MEIFLYLVIGAVLLPYVIGPFVVRALVKIKTYANVKQIDLLDVPSHIRTKVDPLVAQFKQIGYGETQVFEIDGPIENAKGYIFALPNQDLKLVGNVSVIEQQDVTRVYSEVGVKNRQGITYDFNNSGEAQLFENPMKKLFIIQNQHPAAIHDKAVNFLKDNNLNQELIDVSSVDFRKEIEDQINQEFRYWHEQGLLTKEGRHYRLSLKGSFLGTYRQLFPLKGIRAKQSEIKD